MCNAVVNLKNYPAKIDGSTFYHGGLRRRSKVLEVTQLVSKQLEQGLNSKNATEFISCIQLKSNYCFSKSTVSS